MYRFCEAKILGADGIVDKAQYCIAGGHVKIVWLIVSFAHQHLGKFRSFPTCLLKGLSFIATDPNRIFYRKWLNLLQVLTFHTFSLKGLRDSSWLRKSYSLSFFYLASMYPDLTEYLLDIDKFQQCPSWMRFLLRYKLRTSGMLCGSRKPLSLVVSQSFFTGSIRSQTFILGS